MSANKKQKNFSEEINYWLYIPLVGASATTIIVAPYSNYDPINIPKGLILAIIGCLLALYFTMRGNWELVPRGVKILVGAFGISFLISFYFNENDRMQQLLGVYGRSTGLFSLSCLFMILTCSSHFNRINSAFSSKAIQWFCRTSYLVTTYMVVQFADVDPIPWSQKLPVATLGNINFASSLLGMASSIFICRIFGQKVKISERLFFSLLVCLNIALITATGSIQGLLCLLASTIVIVLSRVWHKFQPLVKILVSILSISFAVLLLSGSMGLGLLGNLVRQETAVFRLDYWVAGLRMIISSPIVGLGLDSYGDYYREFRTLEAAIRTGPQRVSNTAHNILIDWGVGIGLLFIFIFFVILARSIWISFSRNSKLNIKQKSENEEILAVVVAWCVFLIISINQLGVAVWGFLFFGLLIGRSFDPEANVKKQAHNKEVSILRGTRLLRSAQNGLSSRLNDTVALLVKRFYLGVLVKFVLLIFFVFNLAIYSIAFRADVKFLQALNSGNFVSVQESLQELTTPSYYYEQAALNSRKSGEESAAVEVSLQAIEKFPRSYTNWAILATSPATPIAIRNKAISRLFALDPHNPDLQREFKIQK